MTENLGFIVAAYVVVWGGIAADRWRPVGWLLAVGSAAAMGYFAWRFAVGQWAF